MTSLSIIQNKKHVRRFPVLLSLFAVIAIYIVPLISQLNMQAHGMQGMDMGGMMMQHHHTNTQPISRAKPTVPANVMPAMSMHHDSDMSMTHMHHDTAKNIADDDKFGLKAACGFCTLLFHLYWLAALTFVLPLIKPLPYPAISCWFRSSTLRQLYSRRLPRAPPRSPMFSYL